MEHWLKYALAMAQLGSSSILLISGEEPVFIEQLSEIPRKHVQDGHDGLHRWMFWTLGGHLGANKVHTHGTHGTNGPNVDS